jgi:hypothetical protein
MDWLLKNIFSILSLVSAGIYVYYTSKDNKEQIKTLSKKYDYLDRRIQENEKADGMSDRETHVQFAKVDGQLKIMNSQLEEIKTLFENFTSQNAHFESMIGRKGFRDIVAQELEPVRRYVDEISHRQKHQIGEMKGQIMALNDKINQINKYA